MKRLFNAFLNRIHLQLPFIRKAVDAARSMWIHAVDAGSDKHFGIPAEKLHTRTSSCAAAIDNFVRSCDGCMCLVRISKIRPIHFFCFRG